MATLILLLWFPRLARYHTVLMELLKFKTLPFQDVLLESFFQPHFMEDHLQSYLAESNHPRGEKNMKMSRESNPGAQSLQTNVQ